MTAVLGTVNTVNDLKYILEEDGAPYVMDSVITRAFNDGVSTPDEFYDWLDNKMTAIVEPVRRGRIQWEE